MSILEHHWWRQRYNIMRLSGRIACAELQIIDRDGHLTPRLFERYALP